MRLTRVLMELPAGAAGDVPLGPEQAHYLMRVLRLKPGAALVVADGAGGEYSAELCAGPRQRAHVRLGAYRAVDRESPLQLQLVLGVSRGERMDLAVQKAVELGVARLTPVLTARSVVQLDGERALRRQAHWAGVARSACEQCGRSRLVPVDEPVPLATWLARADRLEGAVLDPRAPAALAARRAPGAAGLCLLVGPEGGLDETEIDAAAGAGLERVRLGPRVLRAETAALAAVCAAQLLWGDLGAAG